MKDLYIIKDVLPHAYWREVLDLVSHPNFSWSYNEEISMAATGNPFKQNPEIVGTCGFTNTLCIKDQVSNHWPYIKPIVYFAIDKVDIPPLKKEVSVLRCKANLQTQMNGTTLENHNMPHIDPAYFEEKGDNWILLYYLTNADGDTFIFNETAEMGIPEKLTLRKRVTPKANTAILFRDNIYHASSNPVDSRRRLNINFNLMAG